MSFARAAVLPFLLLVPGLAMGGHTAQIDLADSSWQPLDESMPAVADSVYIQVWDPDVTGTLEVEIGSDTEPQGEAAILSEAPQAPGLFRGSIPLQARLHLSRIEDPGTLDVRTGDLVTALYRDPQDDNGDPRVVADSARFTGICGPVQGVWSKENSPYRVWCDAQVRAADTLTIEPGVEVLFAEGAFLWVDGTLRVWGTESEPVLLHGWPGEEGGVSRPWPGLLVGLSAGPAVLSHCRIERAETGILSAGSRLDVSGCEVRYSIREGMRFEHQPPHQYQIRIEDSVIERNNLGQLGMGGISFETRGDAAPASAEGDSSLLWIRGCRIRDNICDGLSLGGAMAQVTGCQVTGNTWSGFFGNPLEGSSIRGCSIYGNGTSDVAAEGGWDLPDSLDFRGNWWGEQTTLEMESSPYPSDISAIWDRMDSAYSPLVAYSGWRTGPIEDCVRQEMLDGGRWEWVAIGVAPESAEAESVFASIRDHLEIALDDEGRAYIPELRQDGLSPVRTVDGYEVFVSGADTFKVAGTLPEPLTECVPVEAGRWNLIPYLTDHCHPECTADVPVAMGPIAGQTDIVVDNHGRAWIPSLGINTIGPLDPREAYRIFLSGEEDQELCYARCTETVRQPGPAREARPRVEPRPTGRPQVIVVTSAAAGLLTAGDEVHVYDGPTLAGAAVVQGELPLAITVWEGDPSHGLPGFTPANPMSAQILDRETGAFHTVEVVDVLLGEAAGERAGRRPAEASFAVEDVCRFVFSPYARVRLERAAGVAPDALKITRLAPNPLRETVEIRYQVPGPGEARLEIYDVSGRLVWGERRRFAAAGSHTVTWNGVDQSARPVASGVYFVRLRRGTDTECRRLMVLQ